MFPPLQFPKIDTEELTNFAKNLSPKEEQEIRNKLEPYFKKYRKDRFYTKIKRMLILCIKWVASNVLEVIAIIISLIALLKQ